MSHEDDPRGPTSGSRRIDVCSSHTWRKLIKRNLKRMHDKPLSHGRLDPYVIFKKEKLEAFYAEHLPHPDRILDNQNFAGWAISEALREYSPDTQFQVTGEIMQGQSIKMSMGKRQVLKKVTETVNTESQCEIDSPNCRKETDGEVVEDIGTIAQCIVAASPNSLGPPIEACAMYLQMERCGEYGRNKLSIWRSPLFPRLDGREGRRGFLDNQITAIVWILSRFIGDLQRLKIKRKDLWDPVKLKYVQVPETAIEKANRQKLRGPKYRGGILADSMGLGKTLTTIAALDILASQRLNVPKENGKERYRPMLIITPNTIVATQWVDEINMIGSKRGIKQIIISGNGFQKRDSQDRVYSMTRDEFCNKWPPQLSYVWDESSVNAAKTVIITSIDAFAGRTCEHRNCKNEAEKDTKKNKAWVSTYTEMGRQFSVVVVDEAYKVRNTDTRNWRSVALLKRQFTLLLTATPCHNHIADLLGPVQMLWDNAEEHLRKQNILSEVQEVFRSPQDLKRLDTISPADDRYLMAGSPGLLAKIIYKHRGSPAIDIQETRRFLKYFESLAILRRAPSSRLKLDWENTKEVSLEGLLPFVNNYTVNIQRDEAMDRAYQEIHVDLLMDYINAVSSWGKTQDAEDLKPVMGLYRSFQLAAASLDVYRLDKLFDLNNFGTKSTDVHAMRKSNINFMHLAPFLLEGHDEKPEVALDYVKLAVRKSPILRYILYYVKENVLGRNAKGKIKKLLITEQNPMLAYYYELVLQFLLIHCRTLHSGLSHEERRELVADFNSDSEHSCQVLIQMYTVGFAGSNLHKNCSQVLVASQAYSLAVQSQAVHRVIRVGQEFDVNVYRLKVDNSFHSFMESRQVEKILPELGTRAQGTMNDVLVQVLNLFQPEIDDVWKSPEAQELLADCDLTDYPRSENEEPDSKRVKLENGKAGQAETAHDDIYTYTDLPLERKRERDVSTIRIFEDGSSDFLDLKPRAAYYKEFKDFPIEVKGYFSHKKNNIRRMLSYGSVGNNTTTRVWKVEDLDDSPVLERAMELILRIRLGADNIEMLPLPQINFSLVPADKLKELTGLISRVKVTDQDIQAAQSQAEAKRIRKDKGLSVLKYIDDQAPAHTIGQVLRDNVLEGKPSKKDQDALEGPSTVKCDSEPKREDEEDDEDDENDVLWPEYLDPIDEEKDASWERVDAASGGKEAKAKIKDSDELFFLGTRSVVKDESSSCDSIDLTSDDPTGNRIKRENSTDSTSNLPNDSMPKRIIKEESADGGIVDLTRSTGPLITNTHESVVIEDSEDD
ncbi:SNF2 family N-terminal domain-containing protein [Daldinia sp. FL1419]|nr:SNF2 family N-terminal domain-containing protein [Daldinia sp. FL1419]